MKYEKNRLFSVDEDSIILKIRNEPLVYNSIDNEYLLKIGRLTEAKYGETVSINDNWNRYTEKVLEYSLNGLMRRFQRHGLKANHVHGKIDNLHIHHVGNQITSVLEDADPITQPYSMDYAGDSPGDYLDMTYDVAGNFKTDKGRGITDIEYDLLNHPVKITFANGNVTEYVYSADGGKLKVTHRTGVANAVSTSLETEGLLQDMGIAEETQDSSPMKSTASVTTDETTYWGNVIYRENKPYMLLIPNGYVTFEDNIPTFHYYTKDYLGNNRTVVNGTTGEIEQSVAYYPFGGVIADLGFGHDAQQYKFGNKELDMANGLNEYDFGARRYYQGVPMFTQPDPMAEKFYWLSPYVYCGNNPVNGIDFDGKEWSDLSGNVIANTRGIKYFIFYSNEFRNQAEVQYQLGIEKYGDNSVAMSQTKDAETFKNDWGNMRGESISEVSIMTHGKNQSILFDNGKQLTSTDDGKTNIKGVSASNVKDLPQPKGNIENATLNFYSCHSADDIPKAHGTGDHRQGDLKGTRLPIAKRFASKFKFKLVKGTKGAVNYKSIFTFTFPFDKDYLTPYPENGDWYYYKPIEKSK